MTQIWGNGRRLVVGDLEGSTGSGTRHGALMWLLKYHIRNQGTFVKINKLINRYINKYLLLFLPLLRRTTPTPADFYPCVSA